MWGKNRKTLSAMTAAAMIPVFKEGNPELTMQPSISSKAQIESPQCERMGTCDAWVGMIKGSEGMAY